jgi:serine/threonine protein kinase
MQAMHTLNAIHRDIKPANILITQGNVYKLGLYMSLIYILFFSADFNISRVLNGDDGKASTTLGTMFVCVINELLHL